MSQHELRGDDGGGMEPLPPATAGDWNVPVDSSDFRTAWAFAEFFAARETKGTAFEGYSFMASELLRDIEEIASFQDAAIQGKPESPFARQAPHIERSIKLKPLTPLNRSVLGGLSRPQRATHYGQQYDAHTIYDYEESIASRTFRRGLDILLQLQNPQTSQNPDFAGATMYEGRYHDPNYPGGGRDTAFWVMDTLAHDGFVGQRRLRIANQPIIGFLPDKPRGAAESPMLTTEDNEFLTRARWDAALEHLAALPADVRAAIVARKAEVGKADVLGFFETLIKEINQPIDLQ